MLFYRPSPGPPGASPTVEPPSPGPTDTQSVGSGSLSRGFGPQQNRTWALKSLATGVSVLGLAYCLVQALQVAGVQYLATLTSVSLLAFLLVYLMWCATSRRRHQLHGGGVESGADCEYQASLAPVGRGGGIVAPRGVTHHVSLPSCSSSVDLHDAELLRSLAAAGVYVGPAEYKPPRTITPPPSYEEAVRGMPPPPPPPPSSLHRHLANSSQQHQPPPPE
ncbi:uncharacterized protein LOC132201484 [Neocloeon triangulifer]|uniref:uncharacterized protein LOC132201484 n=1 Tax=Neocloeon triangulifer TaxID=2078957 RepID=UPI00286EE438|nr:uncharacterized protein LOC132201484 [Neocloeon triangulifer]XP_059483657.1 uncharacterized protein LOC132201484 [Neocloeon triangulifer]XP_059483658.1 uncharacterized protein LOC132201484 [Neocloeon triangulifer]XP_059483659.1 uncharacterized protein LOC132201484 [Neocloeon triangulifer]